MIGRAFHFLAGSLLLASSAFADEVSLNKAIIPVVGSTPGVNGALFHTALQLIGKPGLHGRLVFHPAGKIADDASDPSLPYVCLANGCLSSDDIVAQITQKRGGVGSLDIIPDADSEQAVPVAFTRLWNGPLVGPGPLIPFGTNVPRVLPVEWLARQGEASAEQRVVFIPGVQLALRRSFGLRTLTAVRYSVVVIHPFRFEAETVVSGATLPADYTLFQSLDSLLGRPDDPRSQVKVTIDSGSAIGFFSYTHNITNDPVVIVGSPVEDFGSPTAH